MTRKKKLLMNTIVALVCQIVTIICGFVLPKILIPHFGSKVNGLIGSITQFLTIITLLEAGVGSVVQSSLYKPLATNDDEEISKVIVSSKKFFNRIMIIMSVYVLILIFLYAFIVRSEFDFIYTTLLIIILAFSYMAQHYLFVSYRLLLNADQLSFIQLGVHTICLILNTIITIILINCNVGIHLVKFISALVFAVQPIALKIFVDKRYNLNLKIKFEEEPIKQKWNGFAQHIASVILGNTDTVVLTLFSTLENVSIYGVYYLIVNGVKQILNSVTSGFLALFGNMIAKEEYEKLNKTFSLVEWVISNIVLILYTMVGLLIIPFVKIYTKDFVDANYIVPSFGIMLTLAYAIYAIRVPYEMIIKAAGHYKQTQLSSIIEAIINIVISVLLVSRFGLIGVAIGTFAAMTYRTLYLIWYLSKNILNRSIYQSMKIFLQNIISIVIIIFLTKWIKINDYTYFNWIIMAIKVGLICIIVVLMINIIFNKQKMAIITNLIKKKTVKKRK